MEIIRTARIVICLLVGSLLIDVAASRSDICGGPYPVELDYSAKVVSPQGNPVSGVELHCGNHEGPRATSDDRGKLTFSASVTGQHGCGHECSGLRLVRRRDQRVEFYNVSYRETNGASIVLERPFESGELEQGVREGLWEGRHRDGKLRYRGRYSDGSKNGPWTEWHENGAKKSEGEYVNDSRDGTWREWHQNGQLKIFGDYVDGKMQGAWEFWHPDGQLSSRGKMSGGGRIGYWVHYSRNGFKYCTWGGTTIDCREE